MKRLFDNLVLLATCLTFCVVVLGAYVRLSDAGLGCPDWPGCYGHITVPHADAAVQAFPDKPLETHKAWKEMVHRYFAGSLGLLILAICIVAWRARPAVSPLLPTVLLFLVAFQAALGMWTVTLLLKPAIVSLHLLGGMATFALLVWLAASTLASRHISRPSMRGWAAFGLAVTICQVALGGWTSSNYAALACTEFPVCLNGAWWPATDFNQAFHLVRELGVNADGSALSPEALTAIHLAHRLGALLTFVVLGSFGLRLMREPTMARWAGVLLGLLFLQISLGISNVMLSLPLPVAVAHNGVAALLLATLVVINSKLVGEKHT